MQPDQLTRFTPAETLDEIYQTLSPEPLATERELEAFYCAQMNETRGGDKIKRLKLGLKRAWESQGYYKACLMGHPGVGKSTELNRLINDLEVKKQFQAIKFNVLTDLEALVSSSWRLKTLQYKKFNKASEFEANPPKLTLFQEYRG
ncbi:MAG: hypothetical protein ACKO2V_01695, partial [Snowella sp.]